MEALTIQDGCEELKPARFGQYAADLSSIREARKRIQAYSHTTPVLTSSSLDGLAGRNLFFKCEIFQKGGAFKFRGACNAVFSLDEETAKKGVVTHSSGNHAAALALAAQLRGIPAHIVVPKDAPACKVENVRRYGGHVTFCESNVQAREAEASRIQKETGALLIHPFNDGKVISGQGTIALEFLEQVPELDAIIVPVSGGGLISGIALGAKSVKPGIKVLAAEPQGADDAAQSKASGRVIKSPPTTIADGLRAWLGDLTWPALRDLVDDVLVVEDKQIVEATRMCFERLKIVVEPSGAVGLAAALSEGFRTESKWAGCKKVGIVVTGGNIDMEPLWKVLYSQASTSRT